MKTLQKYLSQLINNTAFICKMECTNGIVLGDDLRKFERCLAHDDIEVSLARAEFILENNLLSLKLDALDTKLPELIIKDMRG